MRKPLLVLALILSAQMIVSGQDDTTSTRTIRRPVLTRDSSTLDKLIEARDSAAQSIEIRQYNESNMRNILNLSQELEKRRKREKTYAMIRIGIGLALLAVLVIGWRRKKKK